MLEQLFAVAADLNQRFPSGNDPFKIMTRLFEECGELAEQINHFEGTGIKQQKLGEPDTQKMAKEIKDVIRNVLQIALYYEIEQEVNQSFEQSYQLLQRTE